MQKGPGRGGRGLRHHGTEPAAWPRLIEVRAGCAVWSSITPGIVRLFHPIDGAAVQRRLDGDMRHRGRRRRSVPIPRWRQISAPRAEVSHSPARSQGIRGPPATTFTSGLPASMTAGCRRGQPHRQRIALPRVDHRRGTLPSPRQRLLAERAGRPGRHETIHPHERDLTDAM
jgi:hypothetical protein